MNWLNGLIGQLNTNNPQLGQQGYNLGSNAANVAKGVSAGVGSVAKSITGAFAPLMGVLRAGASIVSGVFNVASSLFLTGIKVLLGAIAGVIGGFTVLVKQTMDLARSITSIRNATGLSMGQSAGLSFGAGALGIGRQDLASITNNPANLPALFQQRSNALGVGGGLESSGFFGRLATQYQSQASQGAFGRQIANQRLNALFGGSAPDSVRAVANMNPSQIQAQQNFASKAASAVGLDPDKLRQYAEDLPLLTARASTLFEMLRTKLALEVLPAVLQLADGFSTFLSGNIEGIVGTLKTVGRWLITTLPQIMLNVAKFVSDGFLYIAQGAVTLLAMLEDSGSALNQFIGIFAQSIDLFLVGAKAAVQVFGAILGTLNNVGAIFSAIVQGVWKGLNWLLSGMSFLFGDKVAHANAQMAVNAPAWIPFVHKSDTDALANSIPQTDFAANWLNGQQTISKAGMSKDAQAKLDSWKTGSSDLFSTMQSGLDGFKNSQDQTNNKLDKTNATLDSINKNTGKNNGGALGSTVARLASYQIIDTYEMAFR